MTYYLQSTVITIDRRRSGRVKEDKFGDNETGLLSYVYNLTRETIWLK